MTTTQDITIELQPQVAKPQAGKLYINGEFVDSVSGKTYDTMNPATGEVITRIAEAQAEDVDLAVKAAHAAFQEGSDWRKMNAGDRTRVMLKLAELMRANAQEL